MVWTTRTSLDHLTRLVFELCVQFGDITIRNESTGRALTLEIFWPGKQVSDWRSGRLNIGAVET